MIYSDWIQSEHSKRVWLHDSMTALGQFAFIAPIQSINSHYCMTFTRICHMQSLDCVKLEFV